MFCSVTRTLTHVLLSALIIISTLDGLDTPSSHPQVQHVLILPSHSIFLEHSCHKYACRLGAISQLTATSNAHNFTYALLKRIILAYLLYLFAYACWHECLSAAASHRRVHVSARVTQPRACMCKPIDAQSWHTRPLWLALFALCLQKSGATVPASAHDVFKPRVAGPCPHPSVSHS
jgi:hypothetical protein